MPNFEDPPYGFTVEGSGPRITQPSYDFFPTKGASAAFVALFAITTALHLLTACWYRMWWFLPTVGLTCVLELIGWGVRLSVSMDNNNAESFPIFWAQWILLIMGGPNFMVAAMMVTFSQLTKGASLSRFRRITPRKNSSVFLSVWSLAVILQIPGVAITVIHVQDAEANTTGLQLMASSITMLAAILLVFVCMVTEFAVRLLLDAPVRSKPAAMVNIKLDESRSKYMVLALLFSAMVLLVRYTWRLALLLGNFVDFSRNFEFYIFDGPMVTLTMKAGAIDGAMVVLALLCLNVFHPAFLRTFEEPNLKPQIRSVDRLQVPLETVYQRPLSVQYEESSPPQYQSDFEGPILAAGDQKIDISKSA